MIRAPDADMQPVRLSREYIFKCRLSGETIDYWIEKPTLEDPESQRAEDLLYELGIYQYDVDESGYRILVLTHPVRTICAWSENSFGDEEIIYVNKRPYAIREVNAGSILYGAAQCQIIFDERNKKRNAT